MGLFKDRIDQPRLIGDIGPERRLDRREDRRSAKASRIALACAVVLVGTVAAACGGGGNSQSSSPSSGATNSTSSTATSPSAGATSSTASTPTSPSVNAAIAKKYPGCPAHLNDGATAVKMKITNLRAVEYGEISLICGNAVATMYNTTYMNNSQDPGVPNQSTPESAPLPLWGSFSEDSLAQDYSVPSVLKNGPRFWVNDWAQLPIGPTLYFSGVYARWFAYPHYPPGVAKVGVAANPYKSSNIQRNSIMGFDARKPIFGLVNNNTPYVMQAASMQINLHETINSLPALDNDNKLALPTGWSYKVITLTKPLTIQAVNGTAVVTTDNQGNTYDECSSNACSYNPVTGK